MILDNILIISILLVFLGALLGGYLQRRKKDRVLKDMHNFHITARRKGSDPVWGRAIIYANAVELVFTRPYTNIHGNKIVSYIMFSDNLSQLLALYRYHDELTPDNQEKRLVEVDKVINRGWGSIALRQSINFINTFRDAINESMGLLMSRMKGASGSSSIIGSQDARLKKIGTQAVGMVGNSWDPVLERYIGRRVVVELSPEDGEREEYAGLLKEYSQSWLSLFDCRKAEDTILPLDDIERLTMQRQLDFLLIYRKAKSSGKVVLELEVTNKSDQDIVFTSMHAEDYKKTLKKKLAPGKSIKWIIKNLPASVTQVLGVAKLPLNSDMVASEIQLPALTIVFSLIRQVDVLLPRTTATLRHAGEYIDKND